MLTIVCVRHAYTLCSRDVKQSSNIQTSKKVFKLEFVFWPFIIIRLPNIGWSKFWKISSMPALNSGHQRTISRSKCRTYLRYLMLWGNLRVEALFTSSGPGIHSNYTLVILDCYYESTTIKAYRSAWIGPKCNIRWLASSQANIATSRQLSTRVASNVLNYLPSAAAGRIS